MYISLRFVKWVADVKQEIHPKIKTEGHLTPGKRDGKSRLDETYSRRLTRRSSRRFSDEASNVADIVGVDVEGKADNQIPMEMSEQAKT